MDPKLQPIVRLLHDQFAGSLEEFREEAHVFIQAEKIIPVLTLLRDRHQFELLSALTAVDYWPARSPRFHVIYQLSSLAQNITLQLRVPLDGDSPKLPSATRLYETANWRERELFDMFGIDIQGHPDLRRILMPPESDGHPLRKDYPLGYEEPQFTFNYDEIDLRKPYAKE